MIIRCEVKIRPESRKRIEARLCSISEDEDVLIFNITSKMTGKSILWKVKGEEREGMIKYYKKLVSGLLIAGGGFLLLEHLFQFRGFDIEFFGHEYYGFLMICAGFLLSVKWKQLPEFIKAIKEKDIWKILDEGERRR